MKGANRSETDPWDAERLKNQEEYCGETRRKTGAVRKECAAIPNQWESGFPAPAGGDGDPCFHRAKSGMNRVIKNQIVPEEYAACFRSPITFGGIDKNPSKKAGAFCTLEMVPEPIPRKEAIDLARRRKQAQNPCKNSPPGLLIV